MTAGFEETEVSGLGDKGDDGLVALNSSIGLTRPSEVEESSLSSSLTFSLRYFRPILYLTLRNRFSVCSTIGTGVAAVSTAPTVPSMLACRITLTRCWLTEADAVVVDSWTDVLLKAKAEGASQNDDELLES